MRYLDPFRESDEVDRHLANVAARSELAVALYQRRMYLNRQKFWVRVWRASHWLEQKRNAIGWIVFVVGLIFMLSILITVR